MVVTRSFIVSFSLLIASSSSLSKEVFSALGIEEVGETAIPIKKGYKAIHGEIGISDGKKVETWDLIPKDVSELSADEITRVDPNAPEGNSASAGTPELVGEEWKQTWVYTQLSGVHARAIEYGPPVDQIEFITENGLDAWKTKVAEIKALHPKTRTE